MRSVVRGSWSRRARGSGTSDFVCRCVIAAARVPGSGQPMGANRHMSQQDYPPWALPRDVYEEHCRPLMDPEMVPASAAGHMRDDDVVLGLELDGEARAYPWWIMDNHHVANDTVAGKPVVLVLCEACS